MQFSDLDLDKTYTYADYFKWQFEERVELLLGKVFKMSPAPNRLHQDYSMHISTLLSIYLAGKPCRVYAAPFDVRLPGKSKDDKDIVTVFQPDICVVCDMGKLDKRGCIGAPDIVVEILSPGNNSKELKRKYNIYEQAGVKEYWVLMPSEQNLIVYTLHEGKFTSSRLLVAGDVLISAALPGFTMDLTELFSDKQEEDM